MPDDDKPTAEDLAIKLDEVKKKKNAVDAEIETKKKEAAAESDATKKEELDREVNALEEVADGFMLILKGLVSILEGVGKMMDAVGKIGRSVPRPQPWERRFHGRSHDQKVGASNPRGRKTQAAPDG